NKSIAVLNHKKIFFNESKANYDQCLQGNFNLIPIGDQMEQLRIDYQTMIDSNMFYGKIVPFNEIILTIKSLLKILTNQQ
ncbi:MAG: nucleotidyl transferase AbiEii/AbiGii toxin family protein, partial [Candidatus Berkiellales bacterium]